MVQGSWDLGAIHPRGQARRSMQQGQQAGRRACPSPFLLQLLVALSSKLAVRQTLPTEGLRGGKEGGGPCQEQQELEEEPKEDGQGAQGSRGRFLAKKYNSLGLTNHFFSNITFHCIF